MEKEEVLRAILDAEREAASVVEKAEQLRANREARIASEKERLRREYEDKALREIAEVDEAERARTDLRIAELDRDTEARLARLRVRYEYSRADYCKTFFDAVTGEADEK